MIFILLFIAVILLLALLAINISKKSGLPSLLLFLGLGLLSSQLGFEFNDFEIAENFSTVALIIIMFYGGFGTNWKMGRPVVKEAIGLASLGVVFTGLITGLFLHYILNFEILESMLLGSIVASTDYASVSNILASKNLNLKYNTASLLELESGSNDPSAYTMTVLFLSLITGSDFSIPLLVIKQFGLGLAMGFAFAYIVSKLIDYLDLESDGLAIVFMFAMALMTFSATNVLAGNGYLAVYIFGISIGNKAFKGKRDIVYFFDGFTELMSIGLFFLLGFLANPQSVLKALPISFVIMLFITIIARPLSVYSLMLPFRLRKNQLLIISWAGLRGAAAIAFAIFAVNNTSGFSIDIYHIVFGICLLSSLIQGSLMPQLTRTWNMLDKNNSVLRTFNYYVDKGEISFIKAKVEDQSVFVGKSLSEVGIRGDFIIAKIIRDKKSIVPRGEVIVHAGDEIVLVGEEYFDPNAQDLIEFTVSKDHSWAGKMLKDLHLPKNELVLTVNREGNLIKAQGDTQILEGDRLVVFKSK